MKRFPSFAKLNLHLEVVRRRADGYHDLRTVFRTIELADELRVDLRDGAGIELVVDGADLPADRRNLAWRAAEAFLHRWGARRQGVRLELDKRIPVGGGLGGGSGNAATVLLALARLSGLDPFSGRVSAELRSLAATLGADVPFFLLGGTAVGTGRGERLTSIGDAPASAPVRPWIAIPPFGLSTAEVYGRSAPRGERPAFPALARALAGEAVEWSELIGENDLESPAFAVRPELGAMYTALVRAGATAARMSGSGSTLFALFEDSAGAEAAAKVLPSGSVWLQVSTLDRAEWRRASGCESSEGGS